MPTSRINDLLLLSNPDADSDVSVVTITGSKKLFVGVRDGDEELEVAVSEDDARSLLEFLKDHLSE